MIFLLSPPFKPTCPSPVNPFLPPDDQAMGLGLRSSLMLGSGSLSAYIFLWVELPLRGKKGEMKGQRIKILADMIVEA